jgi:Putative beta-barrel porin-2, OmpL-like. bbp2
MLLALVLGVPAASADEPATPATPAATAAAAAAAAAADGPPTRAEIEELKEQNRELREELELLKEDLQQTDQRVDKLSPLAAKVTGYMDFGFYYVSGNGSGLRTDFDHYYFPEYSYIEDSWVFMGDPLSTAINARGEPATTGESRAITYDPIKSKGPTFIINSLNVGLFAQVAKSTLLQAKFDLVPRSLDPSNKDRLFLADFVDVRLAYLEHRITRKWIDLALFAGKFDSVVGFEYRSQEAPTRIEVTPSLICRYTCGYPLGLKARALFADGLFGLNVAITNGTSFNELFPFYDEVDSNQLKTGSARLHIAPLRGAELGVSGSYGAQDRQASDDVRQWMYAVDFHLHRHDLVLRGEFVNGRAKGETEPGLQPCNLAPCLRFKGAYGLLGYRLTNIVMPYVRVDWRDALHRNGASFVYISQVGRATAGLRLALTQNLVVKAEYTYNHELGRAPLFNDDVLTSSLVVTY